MYVCMYRAPKWKLYNDNNIYYVLQYNRVSQNSVRQGREVSNYSVTDDVCGANRRRGLQLTQD